MQKRRWMGCSSRGRTIGRVVSGRRDSRLVRQYHWPASGSRRIFRIGGDFQQAIQQLDFAKRRAGNNFPLSSRIDARQRELIEQERLVKGMMS